MTKNTCESEIATQIPALLQPLLDKAIHLFEQAVKDLGDAKFSQIYKQLDAQSLLQIHRVFVTSNFAKNLLLKNPYYILFLVPQTSAIQEFLIKVWQECQNPQNPNGAYGQIETNSNQNPQNPNGAYGQIETNSNQNPQNPNGAYGQIETNSNQNPQNPNGAYGQIGEDLRKELCNTILQNINSATQMTDFLQSLHKPLDFAWIQTWGENLTNNQQTEAEFMRSLRIWRNFFQTRIIWLDSNHKQNIWQTTKDISNFAKACLKITWNYLVEFYAENWGRAFTSTQEPMNLVILAMGKLGGYELNLSSDLDLIFTYAEQGSTQGGKKSKDLHTYFTNMAQKLIHILDSVTSDGFVFRIDMRLRPYGDSGALVQSFTAMLNYYQDQGRDWERYAMIKASIFNGEQEGAQLLKDLRPFVYRKYLDFGAIDSLRKMKAMISAEVNRKNLENNIKLGTGGIREIEFIVQVWQLIKGGKLPELQTPKIRKALPILANLDILNKTEASELLDSYVFLRNLEHSLQQLDDMQTQNLPEDEISKSAMALRMGFADSQTLLAELAQKRTQVARIFAQIISTSEDSQNIDRRWSEIWQGLRDANLHEFMQDSGYKETATSLNFLASLHTNKAVLNMQSLGKKRLDDFMPLLLAEIAKTQNPDLILQVSWHLVEAVLRRTAYLVLLTENPSALQQLVKICAASSQLVDRLAQMPVLLDELLTPDTLYSPANKESLQAELTQSLLRFDRDDDEEFIQILNYFRQANFLRVAASDLVAQRHIMQVSDYLTFIAEVLLNKVMQQAWYYLTKRFGLPNNLTQFENLAGFLVVGYGKLGGIEMSYTSDLDLVFLHSAQVGQTQGKKSLDNLSFYTRLGQRIIHLLTATTLNGKLYEVDMRLRPSGNSGLLVSSMQAFDAYQKDSAWLWEHQALVKARVICGDKNLQAEFEAIRLRTLRQKRDINNLKQEICAMRHKMQENLTRSENLQIKHCSGGMIDIEFLAQFCVLAYSYDFESIAIFTDVMRILDEVATSKIKPLAEVRFLQESYLMYRQESHRNSLSDITQTLDFSEQRREVQQIWQDWLIN